MRSVKTLDKSLVEWLQKDSTRAEVFLSSELVEYIHDNNLDQLLHSLQCIANASARGERLEFVDSKKVNQKGLDKLLKVDANANWEKVLAVLGYAHLQVSGEPVIKVV